MGTRIQRRKIVIVSALVGLVLAGCSGNDGGLSETQPKPAPPGISAESGLQRQGAPDRAGLQRQEIVTGQVSITAEDPIDTGQQIIAMVEAEGGRVDTITERPGTDDQEPSSSLSVRVPADKLTGTLDQLHEFGEVTSVSVSRRDVTMQVQDVDARIRALTSSVERLQELMARATTTADLIAAEKALSERQGELDSLTDRKRYLADQVEFATLAIEITTSEADGGGDSGSFWDGVVSGWNSLLAALGGAVVVIGAAIPWLIFVGVIAVLLVGAYRLLRRRKRKGTGRNRDDRS